MQHLAKILICLIAFGLYGCGSVTPKPVQQTQLKLLPPVEGPEASLLKQKITMLSQGRSQQFIVVIRLQHNQLKLVSLLPTGQQLFFMEYNGKKLIHKNFTSVDMPGEDMLAIMQFVLWPSNSINKHYSDEDGWVVKITPEQRILLIDSEVLIKVSYQAEVTIVENYLHNYQLRIESLEATDL